MDSLLVQTTAILMVSWKEKNLVNMMAALWEIYWVDKWAGTKDMMMVALMVVEMADLKADETVAGMVAKRVVLSADLWD